MNNAKQEAQAFLLHKAHDDWRGSTHDLQLLISD